MREPTRYVMLTVTVGFEASGKSSALRPLGSRYSVMPSTEVTRVTPAGSAALLAGAAAGGGDLSCASAGNDARNTAMRQAKAERKNGVIRWERPGRGGPALCQRAKTNKAIPKTISLDVNPFPACGNA